MFMVRWAHLVAAICLLSSLASAEQLTLKRAVELALRNSSPAVIAGADETKAKQGYFEIRNQFLPQVVVGSGLAYSKGFPLSLEGSAPAIFNINSSAYVVNFAGREFLKAAKIDWNAASRANDDKRGQVILDTALTYAELDKYSASLRILEEQQEAAMRAQKVALDRFHAGLDPETEVTKAKLSEARVRQAAAHSRGNADILRLHLAQLTGLPAESIETFTESIPPMPDTTTPMTKQQIEQQPAVVSAMESAKAKEQRAKGEHKVNLPTIDFAAQYALLSRFNNYDQFFLKFERNNLSIGAVIRFPIFNPAQNARAQAADAEALRAKKEAEAVKGQVASDALKLQRTVEQLQASRDVAKLEYDLAAAESRGALTRVSAGQATLRDQENAKLAEQQKYSAYLDAQFELDRAQMQLLRQTGQIESWVGLQ
jgi:outer membrane protein TolC